jgi:hypothetical protein
MRHVLDCTCLACILRRSQDRRNARRRMRERMEEIHTPLHPSAAHKHVLTRTGACVAVDRRYSFGRCYCGEIMWMVPVP